MTTSIVNKGKVYIVGVGPGDPELLTIKAKRIIEQCNCLVFDRLVDPRIIYMFNQNAELIDVGKSPNNHPVPQDEINNILVQQALLGKNVVRIKGGDPFVFGRGAEEAEYLISNDISFEIVPGITSAIAVPAYSGIPVTHRECSSSFHVFTGNNKNNSPDIDFKTVAQLSGTLVFLMGVANLHVITQKLLENGMSDKTPCAVIEKGTTPSQRTVSGTLSNIYQIANDSNITSPAITVVGEVAKYHQSLSWQPVGPLTGKKIIVTRSRKQSSELSAKLLALGAEIIEFPTIQIEPPEDIEKVYTALNSINNYQLLVFTSPNGVEHFFSAMQKQNIDIRKLSTVKIAVVGQGTASKLAEYGIFPELMPEIFTTTELAKTILKKVSKNEKILLARSNIGSEHLSQTLANAGYDFTDLCIYKTKLLTTGREKLLQLYNNDTTSNAKPDFLTFASSSSVTAFAEIIGKEKMDILQNTKIISIGPITTQTCIDFNLNVYMEASPHTIDGIVASILKSIEP